jgi:hypothetical protein
VAGFTGGMMAPRAVAPADEVVIASDTVARLKL